jgi:HSP20 family protein
MEPIEALEKDVAMMYREWMGRSLPAPDPSQPYAPLRPDQDPQVQVLDALKHLTGMVEAQLHSRNQAPPWAPAVQVWEADESWRIEVDLPGVQRRQVRLSCSGPYLWIRGERTRSGAAAEQPHWNECPNGTFERRILVPAPIEPQSVTSQFKEGVLRVQVPKGTKTSNPKETEIDLS